MIRLNLLFFILIIVGVNTIALGQNNRDFKGRIAWSADGNFKDENDWAASPLALSIFAEAGLKEKLVHFNYNCNLTETIKSWELNHEKAVLGAAKLYNYELSNFYNCQHDLDTAVRNITSAVNASSEDNPLYFIIAGSMEVPYMGILNSDPEKRKHVYCISHNNWNEGYISGELENNNKREIISSGVKWIQIADQNTWLNASAASKEATLTDQGESPIGDENWKPWLWMRDSEDEKVRFIWEMLQLETRPNVADAGMAYFLVSGDEVASLPKIKRLIEDKKRLYVIGDRKRIRMEAENFNELKGLKVNCTNEKEVTPHLSVIHSARLTFEINTEFREPYVADRNTFDLSIRYYSGKFEDAEYTLLVNDRPQDTTWLAVENDKWQTKTIKNVLLKLGDKISIQVEANRGSGIQFDYIELLNTEENNPFFATPTWPLPSPSALPGQLVVLDKTQHYPGYLAYNGVGPAFLCGPGNPEDFLWLGNEFDEDGILKDSLQVEMIQRLADNQVNAIRFQMFRMQKSNLKNEGDNGHGIFVDNDHTKGIDLNVLFQWERLITKLEKAGVAIHLEFYNNATDVEKIGWGIQPDGNLHPDELRFVKSVVHRFKHHKNIIWGIQEAANTLDRKRVRYFKTLAGVIADTDKYNHPIVQSFVVPNNAEGDFQTHSGLPDDYLGDSNIDIITWLQVNSHGDLYEDQYEEYKKLYDVASRKFVVMKNETSGHAQSGRTSRIAMWASTMTGTHCLEASHNAFDGAEETLFEDGLISNFMEQTDYQNMFPRNDLKHANTNWVLADPGISYIAYSYDCESELGLKQMTDGVYQIYWMDTESGKTLTQYNVAVAWGNNSFEKPEGFGDEVVAYVLRKY